MGRRVAGVVAVMILCWWCIPAHAEKWQGVDETVVQKIAGEHGRSAGKPLIELEGDLELAAFLLAGAVGGFAAGYYWRVLMEGKKKG